MKRIILHCDLNNFFASVSLLSNRTLVDLPVAVCGEKSERHGIVLAKNEIAKKAGVKTAEPIWQAKLKCPDLITLPPDYEKYSYYSKEVRKIYERYTDIIEPFGIDECWLDVTGSTLLFGSGEKIANEIRNAVKQELGLTISVGVSFNKVFAKLGSDLKKPDAVTVISEENFKEKIWNLPLSSLLFAGKKTAERLNSAGVYTIRDITLCEDKMLLNLLGKNGAVLKSYALGQDTSPVNPAADSEPPKSVGRSTTKSYDLETRDDVWRIFVELSDEIASNLRHQNLFAGGIQVHTRDATLKIREFSRSLEFPTDTSIVIAKHAMDIFNENYFWELPLRSIGVRAINLKPDGFAVQGSIFSDRDYEEKQEKIEDSIFKIREKFGTDSIKRASLTKSDSHNKDK